MSGWEFLSSASSHLDKHSCQERGGRGCRACRWFETTIERRRRPPDPGAPWEYKVEMVGRTSVPGEFDRHRIERTTSPHAVVDFLAMGEPGSRYVPKVSRKVLHEAGDRDPAIADALDDFDEIAGASR